MKLDKTSAIDKDIRWDSDTTYALGLYKQLSRVFGFWPIKNRLSSGIKVGIISSIQVSSISDFRSQVIQLSNHFCVRFLSDCGCYPPFLLNPSVVIRLSLIWGSIEFYLTRIGNGFEIIQNMSQNFFFNQK